MNDSTAYSEIVPSNLTALKFYRSFANLVSLLQEFGYQIASIQDYLSVDDYASAFGGVRQKLVEFPNAAIEQSQCYEYVFEFIRSKVYWRYSNSLQIVIAWMKEQDYNVDFVEELFEAGEWSLAWEQIYIHLAMTSSEAIRSTEAYQWLYDLFGDPTLKQHHGTDDESV